MMRSSLLTSAAVLVAAAACRASAPTSSATATPTAVATEIAAAKLTAPATGTTSIVRLDCGSALVKNFDKFFSDRPGLYPAGARRITDSCYLIRHDGHRMIWDTGFPAAWKGKSKDMGDLVVTVDQTLAEQLATLGLKPADIDTVGISHMHGDHTGQAADFPQARLVIGQSDFDKSAAKHDPFGPWRGPGKKLTALDGDIDLFGDGDVIALFTPGHTAGHLALLVKLKSGDVLLSGDVYHSTMAREKRGVPPFNTDRAQTLKSMDRFEAIARETHAKVIIQHEPDDIAKLPTFPQAAE